MFDAGPTVITAPHTLDDLFELAGRRREDYVEFIPVRPFYRLLWEDGTCLDYESGDALSARIERLFPRRHRGLPRASWSTRGASSRRAT